jgi:hypothetical protein
MAGTFGLSSGHGPPRCPRVMLRYAVEKLDKAEPDRYLAMKRR